jgi:hypothetical protein
LVGVNEWLETYRRFWTESLDRLNEHLNKTGGS